MLTKEQNKDDRGEIDIKSKIATLAYIDIGWKVGNVTKLRTKKKRFARLSTK